MTNVFKNYSLNEFFLRAIWSIIYPVFFKLSPRLLYEWRNIILRLLGAKIGKSVKIYPSTIITFPWLLEIGDYSVIAWNVRIYNLGKIEIGSRTIISQYSHLCGGTHDYKTNDFKLLRTDLSVGNKIGRAHV